MPEKLREKIIAACGALTAEQQQLLIDFIWLREHGPQAKGERLQKRLIDLLELPGVDSDRISAALRAAIAELHRTR